jgi:choline dehydrogenase
MSFDYIIVGAGSAGCVLANRLSENPDCRVLLLEAGGRDWNPFIHMPAGLAKLAQFQASNWGYHTEPEQELAGRRLYWPRGKVLGGSSSINAMCYIRGQAADYDQWEQDGNTGWSYADLLPYFRRSENNERGADSWHGEGGPLNVQDLYYHNRLSEVFLEASVAAGHERNTDFNGRNQKGVGFYQVTQKHGKRCSTAAGYLRPAMSRSNLTVITEALSRRVMIENGRAIGVEYARRNRVHKVRADKEVILCGGAINSPQLLQLSGIGPADHLLRYGIRVHSNLASVGSQLQDHLDICLLDRCKSDITYDKTNDLMIGLNYWLMRRGIGTSNIAESGGFSCSSHTTADRPDLQFHFVPAQLDDHGRHRLPGYGYTIHVCALRPESRGSIMIRSADPLTAPAIHANYLSETKDLEVMLDGVEQAREILSSAPFAPYRKRELMPGDDCRSRSGLIAYIRRKAESIYHPVGTCRMGTPEDGVVDAKLRVHGIDCLRVVDASVMPRVVSGNTNAPTIAIAERAADLIQNLRTDTAVLPKEEAA